MANIRKREKKDGSIYYTVQIRLKGQKPQNQSFTRLTDARKWVTQTEAAIQEGRHFKTNEAKKHTLAEAIDRYCSGVVPKFTPNEQRIRLPILKRWKNEIGHLRLSDVTATELSACRDNLLTHGGIKGRPLAADTVKRHFLAISHVFKICQLEWRWIDQNPLKEGLIEMPELPRGIVRFLDDDELSRLTAACKVSSNSLLYPAFILSISTGMRQGETMNLYWREPSIPPSNTAWGVVNLSENCIILHQTKNGKRRRVPLVGEALKEITTLSKIQRLDTRLVFPSTTHPQKPIELKKAWTTALKSAEVTNFRWHDLRHTAASYLAQSGAPLLDIAEILGHSTLQMVQRYAHLSESHITATVTRMNEKIG